MPPPPHPASQASIFARTAPPPEEQELLKARLLHEREVYASLRSEEHTSELQSHSDRSYAVFCMKKKTLYQDA